MAVPSQYRITRWMKYVYRVTLGAIGLIAAVFAVIAVPKLPGDHSTADAYHRAPHCAAAVSPDCVSTATATVQGLTTQRHTSSTSHTKHGSVHHSYSYTTDIKLSVPTGGGETKTQTVTVDGTVSAGNLPNGSKVPVTMWRNSVVKFQIGSTWHQSSTDPDRRLLTDKIMLLAGLPIALLTLRLLLWTFFRGRVPRGPFRLGDTAMLVLTAATFVGVLGGIPVLGVAAAVAALAVLAVEWIAARIIA